MTVSKPETVEVTQALEPCPFCGSDKVSFDIMSRDADGEPSDYSPECPSCGATIISGPGENLSKERATSLWNRRHRLNATPSRQEFDAYDDHDGGQLDPGALAKLKNPTPAGLRDVAIDLAASLAAAISLLEKGGKAAKKAAPSDKMFDQMLRDYTRSLSRARLTLSATPSRQDGWVSVPRVPTREMYEAAFESSPWDEICPIRRVVDEVWNAMLRAALSDTPPPDKAAGQ